MDLTLSQVVARLQRLEHAVQSLGVRLDERPAGPAIEYIIRVNGEETWRGTDLDTHFEAIRRQHPAADIVIGWETMPIVLV